MTHVKCKQTFVYLSKENEIVLRITLLSCFPRKIQVHLEQKKDVSPFLASTRRPPVQYEDLKAF